MLQKLTSNANLSAYKWLVTPLTGLFLFVVLYVYKGYNIDQVPSLSGHSLFERAILHAVATSLLFYVCEFHIRKLVKLTSPPLLLLWILAELIVGMHIAFFLFNYFWQWTEMHWISYRMFFYEYPLVILIPIFLSLLMAPVVQRSSAASYIVITSENKKDQFKVKPEHLLFVQSADNYVEIHYISQGEVKKHLMRKSLKDLAEEYASSPYLVRCHRSYMVNPANIDHVQSTSKSMQVSIAGTDIPVSKNYAPHLSGLFTPYLESSSQTA